MVNNLERSGIYFGTLTSVMTILSFILGIIGSGRFSKTEIIGSIITMSVCDSMADAYGFYISNKSHGDNIEKKDNLKAGFITLITKIIIQISFILPFFFLDTTNNLILASSIWGFIVLTILSKYIAKTQNTSWSKEGLTVISVSISITIISILVTKWIISIKHHFK